MEAEPEPEIHRGADDSLDSDGYEKNDPYAQMAKKIDRRAKVVGEFEERPLIKMSNKVIE